LPAFCLYRRALLPEPKTTTECSRCP